jgi:fructose-1,6-bisphosphatase/inositol monophosphatase family enzyme
MDLQPPQLNAMLETAVDAARLAGRQALDQMTLVEVSVKNGVELVTEADRACQQTIVERIKADFPDHGFIAEEGQHGRPFKQAPQGTEPVWWVIDPIDGTNNFAHGMPVFAVSIGAMIDGSPRKVSTEGPLKSLRKGQSRSGGSSTRSTGPITSPTACPCSPSVSRP